MYRRIPAIRQIVDAYAKLVPWGGLLLRCPDGDASVEINHMEEVVRELLLNGRAEA
jgi:hypothetical protein